MMDTAIEKGDFANAASQTWNWLNLEWKQSDVIVHISVDDIQYHR